MDRGGRWFVGSLQVHAKAEHPVHDNGIERLCGNMVLDLSNIAHDMAIWLSPLDAARVDISGPVLGTTPKKQAPIFVACIFCTPMNKTFQSSLLAKCRRMVSRR